MTSTTDDAILFQNSLPQNTSMYFAVNYIADLISLIMQSFLAKLDIQILHCIASTICVTNLDSMIQKINSESIG